MSRVCYVEEAELEPLEECSVFPCDVHRGFSEPDEMVFVIRLEIVRDSSDLELTNDLRTVRVLEVYDEQWVNSLESDKIGSVAEEAGSVECVSRRDSLNRSYVVKIHVQHLHVSCGAACGWWDLCS